VQLAWFCHQVVYSLSIKEVIQVFLCIFSDLSENIGLAKFGKEDPMILRVKAIKT
jgi:hypothetical protein